MIVDLFQAPKVEHRFSNLYQRKCWRVRYQREKYMDAKNIYKKTAWWKILRYWQTLWFLSEKFSKFSKNIFFHLVVLVFYSVIVTKVKLFKFTGKIASIIFHISKIENAMWAFHQNSIISLIFIINFFDSNHNYNDS